MKKRMLVALLSLAAVGAGAAPFDAKAVPDTARWVVHADLDALKATRVGGFIMGHFEKGAAADKMAALAAMLQFDPRRDLEGMTVYGTSQKPEEAVAQFSGTFNGEQLVTLLKANPSYMLMAHGAQPIHSWIDEKRPEVRQYGAIVGNKVLISQGLPALQEAVDVLVGGKPALDAVKRFGALPVEAPFFMAGTDMQGFGEQAGEAQILSQTRNASLSLGEAFGKVKLAVVMNAPDAEKALQVQQVMQGMVAMGMMNQEKEPELAAVLQSAKVTLEETCVTMTLEHPADQVIAFIKKMAKKHAAGQQAPAVNPAP